MIFMIDFGLVLERRPHVPKLGVHVGLVDERDNAQDEHEAGLDEL